MFIDNRADRGTNCQILPLKDGVLLNSTSEGRKQNILVLQNAMERSLQALEGVLYRVISPFLIAAVCVTASQHCLSVLESQSRNPFVQ